MLPVMRESLGAGRGPEPADVVWRRAALAEAEDFAGWLTPEESAQAARLSCGPLRARFVVSRGLRRRLLAQCTGLPAGRLVFAEDGAGKPRLSGDHGWDFNASHSGEHVVVAARLGPVGIDLEAHRAVREEEAIVRRYFHPDEARAWRGLPGERRSAAFFLLWSAREAAMKCAGLGLARGMAQTRVDPVLLETGTAMARVGDMSLRVSPLDGPEGCTLVVAVGPVAAP